MPIMDIAALRVFAIVVLMPWLLAASNAAAQDESCRDSFQYDVVVPFQLVCPDSMYAFDPSAVGHSGNLERFCFDRMASRAQANLGSAVVVPTGVSPTNVRMDAPFDRIWIRGNLSRMSCDLWTLGRLNKSYVLTTSSAVEFLDLVTGEVCFAESLTAETTLPVQAKSTDFDVSGLIDAAIAAQVDTTLGGPLATIAANYAPGCVQANVLGRHGDSVVLDRGTRDGVAAGQMFRNEDCVLCVSSAQSGFCLARTTRGDPPSRGTQVSRFSLRKRTVRAGSATLMVTRPELPKALLGNPKFTVTAEHVQEWIHSYLLRNTDLAVLPPAGNLVRQQAETASTSDVATDVMLGNRERPDLFVNVRIARATLEEVKGPEGESHCFFTLEPELEIVDCRTGLVQFCRSYPYRKDYTFSDVPNPRYWTAGRAGRFASTTRDALHAAACSLATAFEPAQASGSIRALDGTTAEFALDHGAVGPGVVFEIRRAGDEVRGLDGRTLGRFQERIGGARVISVGAEGNFVKVTSANQPVKVGDVLFVASSPRDPLLSARVLQIGEVTVEDRTNQGMANLPVETAGQVLERALVSRRSWAVLPAESGLRRHQEHRATLERGNFAIDGWADQSADVVADALVNLRLVMLPEREGPKGELILSVQGSFEVVDANGAVLYTDVEPVSKAIQRSRDPMKLSLGAGMDARPGRYADLTKSLVDKLVSDYR